MTTQQAYDLEAPRRKLEELEVPELYDASLSPAEAGQILTFLARVDLKGAEAPILTQLAAKLKIIAEPDSGA